MSQLILIAISSLACFTVAQRPPYAGSAVPGLLPQYRPTNASLGNRVGLDNSTPLPSELQGTLNEDKLVQRVSEWPEEKQPYWYKNKHTIQSQREQAVDGNTQQAPRPRPPFAGSEQQTTIDREESEYNKEAFDTAQSSYKPYEDQSFTADEEVYKKKQEQYKTTKRPYYSSYHHQKEEITEKPYHYEEQKFEYKPTKRPYFPQHPHEEEHEFKVTEKPYREEQFTYKPPSYHHQKITQKPLPLYHHQKITEKPYPTYNYQKITEKPYSSYNYQKITEKPYPSYHHQKITEKPQHYGHEDQYAYKPTTPPLIYHKEKPYQSQSTYEQKPYGSHYAKPLKQERPKPSSYGHEEESAFPKPSYDFLQKPQLR